MGEVFNCDSGGLWAKVQPSRSRGNAANRKYHLTFLFSNFSTVVREDKLNTLTPEFSLRKVSFPSQGSVITRLWPFFSCGNAWKDKILFF